jgi:type III restriction enzyme
MSEADSKFTLSDDPLDRMVREAERATANRDPRTVARSVVYLPATRQLLVTLESGHRFRFDAELHQAFATATDRDLASVGVDALGNLWSEQLGEGASTGALIAGSWGSKSWMAGLRERLPADRLRAPALEAPLPPAELVPGSQEKVVQSLRARVDRWRGFPLATARDPYPEDPATYEPGEAFERPISPTTRTLLQHWFRHDAHTLRSGTMFKYWPHQRRTVETFIYLHEVCGLRRTEDLFRLSGFEPFGRQQDPWHKLGAELATGSGKTKVMSLLVAWAYFNSLLHGDAYLGLGRHSLIVAPGLFVRDRLLLDFRPDDGSAPVFLSDPVLPPSLRDLWNVRVYGPDDCPLELDPAEGVLVVTNYHQLLNEGEDVEEELERTREEHQLALLFRAQEPKKLEEARTPLLQRFVHSHGLLVINDEAHRVGDEPQHQSFERKAKSQPEKGNFDKAWIRSLRLLNGSREEPGRLGLQVDLSATLFEEAGIEVGSKTLFRHTAVQYGLAEARTDGIIKKAVLEKIDARRDGHAESPVNAAGQNAWDKYRVLVRTGIERWKKVRAQLREEGSNSKPIILLLCEDQKHAREIANFLTYGEALDADLSMRTPTGWEDPETEERLFVENDADGTTVSTVVQVHVGEKETTNEKEWEKIRRLVNFIDRDHVPGGERDALGRPVSIPNPFNVVVSVLMLREGWDVRNVKVIVPMRSCASRTLTEQVLGRGLRKMHPPQINEDGSVLSKDEELFVVEHPSFEKVLDQIQDLVEEKESGEITHEPEYVPILPIEDQALRAERDVRIVRFDGLYEEQPDWRRELPLEALPPLSPRFAWRESTADLEVRTTLHEALAGTPSEEGLGFKLSAEPGYRDVEGVLLNLYVKPLLDRLKVGYSHQPALKGLVREFLERRTFAVPAGVRITLDSVRDPEEGLAIIGNLARSEVVSRVREALLPLLEEAVKGAVPVSRARLIETRAAELEPYQAMRKCVLEPAQKCVYARQALGNDLELRVARLLDQMPEVTGWVYNHRRAPGWSLDYVWRDLRVPYFPDFLVRARIGDVWHQLIVESKGRYDDRDRAKATAAVTLCETLTRHDREPWHYLLLLENESEGRRDVSELEALQIPALLDALRMQEKHGLLPSIGAAQLLFARAAPEVEEDVPPSDRFRTAVPVYDLVPFGGGFSGAQAPRVGGWMHVQVGRRLSKGMYVSRVEGRSMEPGVPAGSWCLFRHYPPGSAPSPLALSGKRVVVQLRDDEATSDGGAFTLKRLQVRELDEDGSAKVVSLVPDNPLFEERRVDRNASDLAIVAELLEVIG